MGKSTLVFIVAFAVFNPVFANLSLIFAVDSVLLHHVHQLMVVHRVSTLATVARDEGGCRRLVTIEGLSWGGRWRIRDEGRRLEGWGSGCEGRCWHSFTWDEFFNPWSFKAYWYERLGSACCLQEGCFRFWGAHRLTRGRNIRRVVAQIWRLLISVRELIIHTGLDFAGIFRWIPWTCLNILWAEFACRIERLSLKAIMDTLCWWCENCLGVLKWNLHSLFALFGYACVILFKIYLSKWLWIHLLYCHKSGLIMESGHLARKFYRTLKLTLLNWEINEAKPLKITIILNPHK